MGKGKYLGLGVVILVAVFLVVGMTGTAFAANPTSQPTSGGSTMVGDPVGSDISPHGGYFTSTDYCLQCHKQHGAYTDSSYNTGAYALIRNESVVATCNTCHSVFTIAGSGAYNPGISGESIGTAATRAVYENGNPGGDITGGNGHGSIDADPGGTTSCPAGVVNCTYPHVPPAGVDGIYGHKIGYGVSALGGANTASRYTPNWDFTVWQGLGSTTMPANSSTRSGPGTASEVAGGFYCGTCHSPHGADFGYVVNTEKGHGTTAGTWFNGSTIWWENFGASPQAGVPAGEWGQVKLFSKTTEPYGWVVCATTAADNTDASCVPATTQNATGQTVSLYAYQLLTSGPNHQYTGGGNITNVNLCSNGLPGTVKPTTSADCTALYGAGVVANYAASLPAGPQSYKIDQYNHDGAQWCGTCHSYALDMSLGGAVHAHPTGCDACHGNTPASMSSPGGTNGYPDFPHSTAEESMLKELPDGLCISCHTNLP